MTQPATLCAFPITPADADGRIDVAALRRLLARLTKARVDGIGLLGSTGSFPYLSRDERRRGIETVVDEAADRMPILAGIGALRTDETIRLAQDARDAGAAAGLLAPMSYTPLQDDEVFEHFRAVAEKSRLPLCIYDNPATTHFTFGAALIGRLSRIEGVVALKGPAPEASRAAAHLRELRASVPADFSVGCSVDWNALEALLAGSDAWYSVVAGLFPEPCVAIVRAVRERDASEARRLDVRLQPLWDLFREFSSLRVIYAAADILGLCRMQPPRPILPLPEAVRRRIGRTLAELGLD